MTDRTKLMTVSELIAALQKFDGNLPVYLDCDDYTYSGPMSADLLAPGKITFVSGGLYHNVGTGGTGSVQAHWTVWSSGEDKPPVDCLKIIVE